MKFAHLKYTAFYIYHNPYIDSTKVKIADGFSIKHRIEKLDVIRDAINQLESIYNNIHKQGE